MARYNEEFRQRVVQAYLSGDGGYKTLAAKYGINHSMLQRWVGAYRQYGDAGLRKKFNHYSVEFKLSVLKRMREQELSYTQAVVLFDVRGGTGVISSWDRLYDEGGVEALKPKPRGRPKMMKTPQPPIPEAQQQSPDMRTVEDLRKENEYLRAEVAYLKKLDALVRSKKQAARIKRKP